MPSSSSSEDEDFSKFKEAADSVLYRDSLYENAKSKQVEAIPATQVSLRNIDGDVEANIHQELNVTPAFQKHVAKHLSKLLDSQLEISEQPELKKDQLDRSRCILKAKRKKNCDGPGIGNEGGVRLLRQSADFLSNLDIVPLHHRMKRIGRKVASHTSESSSDESDDSSKMQKLSDAAVSSDWLLSGAATKGWAVREDRIEKCRVNESGIIVPIKNGFEMLNEVGCSDHKKVFNVGIKDDKVSRSLKRKSSTIDSELAASFSSVVCIGTDSQGDSIRKSKNKVRKKKRRKKEQHSEDATTETTEVEDFVEKERKVKKSKKKKKPKHVRKEEKRREEVQMLNNCVPGLLCEDEELESKHKEKRKKKHKETKLSRHLFLKEKRRRSFKKTSKKKLKKKMLHLSEDLAKLMVTSKGNLGD